MKKLIIFDLQDTLVSKDKILINTFEKLKTIVQKSKVNVSLYSVNEPWTLDVLQMLPDISVFFGKLLLVDKKQINDFQCLTQGYSKKEILVVGDGIKQELYYAKRLQIDAIDVNGVDDFVIQIEQILRGVR